MENQLEDKLIQIRRQIHQFPELGFHEFKTSALVQQHLTFLGISFETIAATGVVGTLKKGEGPIIVLRSDMDALALKEETGLDFSSLDESKMHACGHDLHTTMLIGAAYLLKEKEFNGTIRFLFQPSEEGNLRSPQPGKSGGQIIAETGLLDSAQAIIGLHVNPLMDVGTLGYTDGEALANVCNFVVTVRGKSGHAGALEHVIDPVLISSQLIVSAQSIISHTAPTQPAVLAFTTTEIVGEPAYNIIPETVILKGSLRVLSLATYNLIVQKLKTLLRGMEISYECKIDIDFTAYYPSLLNDSGLNKELASAQEKVFGKEAIQQGGQLIAEDFAFYSRQIPAVFYFLGAGAETGQRYFLHHPRVIFNEKCIAIGANFLCETALKLLS